MSEKKVFFAMQSKYHHFMELNQNKLRKIKIPVTVSALLQEKDLIHTPYIPDNYCIPAPTAEQGICRNNSMP